MVASGVIAAPFNVEMLVADDRHTSYQDPKTCHLSRVVAAVSDRRINRSGATSATARDRRYSETEERRLSPIA